MRQASVGLVLLMLSVAVATVAQPPMTLAGEEDLLDRTTVQFGDDPEEVERALRELAEADQPAGQRVEATTALARYLIDPCGKCAEALEVLAGAEEWMDTGQVEELAQAMFRRAWLTHASRRLEELMPLVDEAIGARPGSRGLLVLMGFAEGQIGDPERAAGLWQKAVGLEPTPLALRELVGELQEAKHYEEALATAQRIEQPTLGDRVRLIGYTLAALERVEEAVALADELSQPADLSADDLRTISRLLAQCKAHDKRIALLERALAAGTRPGDEAATRNELGGAYEDKGDLEAAHQQRALAGLAGNSSAKTWLAGHAGEKVADEAAFDALVEACFVGWTPAYEEVHEGVAEPEFRELGRLPSDAWIMGEAVQRDGKLPQLISAARRGAEAKPGSVGHLSVLIVAATLGDDLPAAAEAARALNAVDAEVVPLDRVGMAYAKAGNCQEAVRHFDLASEGPLWHPQACRWAGKCYTELGQPEKLEAIATALREPREVDWLPESASFAGYAEYAEAMLWLGAGETERAIALLEKSKDISSRRVDRDLARAYQAVGRIDDACTVLARALRYGGRTWLPDARLLAELLRGQGPPREYIAPFAKALREQPTADMGHVQSVWREVLDEEAKAGRAADLLAALEAETKATPDDGVVLAVLGLAQMQADDPAAAKESFEKTTKLRSGQWLFMEERKLAYERARAASPGAQAAEAGKAYWEGFRPALQAGDMEKAAQLACEFLATQPTDPPDRVDAAALQTAMNAKAGRPYEAFVEAVQVYVDARPDSLGPGLLLLHALQQSKQYDRLAALAEAHEDALVAAKAAYYLAKAEQWATATTAATTALANGSDRGHVNYEVARAYRELGMWDETAALCERAMELAPDAGYVTKAKELLEEAKGHAGGP
jgi:tetratricopeptide (TPR) repeat protein